MNQITNKLKQDYENICTAIVDRFAKKHGYEFDGWVSNDIGGIAGFIEQYFFNLQDMANDIFTAKPKGLIFEWQDYIVENTGNEYTINFENYCKGARY